MTFDEAFDTLIGHEGGYSNDPRDPGGETRYGISKRAYPDVNIATLTLEQAKFIKAHPELPHTELAKLFGLSPNCIRGVRIGRTWKDA